MLRFLTQICAQSDACQRSGRKLRASSFIARLARIRLTAATRKRECYKIRLYAQIDCTTCSPCKQSYETESQFHRYADAHLLASHVHPVLTQ